MRLTSSAVTPKRTRGSGRTWGSSRATESPSTRPDRRPGTTGPRVDGRRAGVASPASTTRRTPTPAMAAAIVARLITNPRSPGSPARPDRSVIRCRVLSSELDLRAPVSPSRSRSGRPLPPTCWPNGTGMGVPTPAPGVGTFRTPLTGAGRTPERTVGPLISVRRRRGERSGGKTLGQGRTDWPSRADLTYSGTDVNSVRLPGVMLTRDGEQSPDPVAVDPKGGLRGRQGGNRGCWPR